MSATNDKPFNPFLAYAASDLEFDDLDALYDALSDVEGIVEDSPGGRLKFLRERKGLSLRALASLISEDTHFTTIAKLETGKMKMTDDWAAKLGKALRLPVQAILANAKAPESARSIPVYYLPQILDEKKDLRFGEPHDTQITNLGGAHSFALPVDFNEPIAPYEGFVVIDPDDRKVRAYKLYLIMVEGNEYPILAKYEPDPAMFRVWIQFEEDAITEVPLGEVPFKIFGRVILVTYTP